jgi:hypothetical protein
MPDQQANQRRGVEPDGLTCEVCDLREVASVDATGRFLCDECGTDLLDAAYNDLWEVCERHAPQLGAEALERLLRLEISYDVVKAFADESVVAARVAEAKQRAETARRLLEGFGETSWPRGRGEAK